MSLEFYHYSAIQSMKTESHCRLLPIIVLECLRKYIMEYVLLFLVQYRDYDTTDRKSYLALHMAILSRIFEYKKNAWRLYAWHIKNQQVICVLRNFQRLFLYLTYLN